MQDLWNAGLPLRDYNGFLRFRVKKSGLPHSAFAKLVGIHKAAWVALVQGKTFREGQLDAVARALSMTPDQLAYALAPERHCPIPEWSYGGIEGSLYCTVCPEAMPEECDPQNARDNPICPCCHETDEARIRAFTKWVATYGHRTGLLEVVSNDEPCWLTSATVAKRYGISPQWARFWMRNHYQNTFKAGKSWLVDPQFVRDHPWKKEEE